MNLDILLYSFSVTFLQILSVFMFIQDKEKQEKRIGYMEKRKVLEDFYKGKSLTLKVLIDF